MNTDEFWQIQLGAAEFALVKVRISRIDKLVREKRPFATTARWLAPLLFDHLASAVRELRHGERRIQAPRHLRIRPGEVHVSAVTLDGNAHLDLRPIIQGIGKFRGAVR